MYLVKSLFNRPRNVGSHLSEQGRLSMCVKGQSTELVDVCYKVISLPQTPWGVRYPMNIPVLSDGSALLLSSLVGETM